MKYGGAKCYIGPPSFHLGGGACPHPKCAPEKKLLFLSPLPPLSAYKLAAGRIFPKGAQARKFYFNPKFVLKEGGGVLSFYQ